MSRSQEPDDWFTAREPALLADGWIFYRTSRYDPTIIEGYTPTAVAGNPAHRRKANRPFYLWLRRSTEIPTDPWDGTLRLGATSTLQPWIAGVSAPYGEEADWAYGSGAHYLSNGDINPTLFDELDGARNSPAGQVTKQYTGIWAMDPAFPNDWTEGGPDSQVAFNAMVDLFASVSVPA